MSDQLWPWKLRETIWGYIKDPFLSNSFFLMMSYVLAAALGFGFLVVAAWQYSPEEVGIATAMIAAVTFLASVSRLGLDYALFRFFPERDRRTAFGTFFIVSSLTATLGGVVFVLGVDVWSPGIQVVKSDPIFFILFTSTTAMVNMSGVSFIAMRNSKLYFLQNLVGGTRILMLPLIVALGALGIFASYGLAMILSLGFSFLLLIRMGLWPGRVDRGLLRDSFHYSAGNYIASILTNSPASLLPIIVLNLLGAASAAAFYVAFTISSLAFIVPNAISISLLVEGSHGGALRRTAMRSLIISYGLLSLAVAFFAVAGQQILDILGKSYGESGYEFMMVMILSSFFVANYQIYVSIKNVQKDIRILVLLGFLNFILLLGLSVPFITAFGLVGVGYAWILGYGFTTVVIVALMKRDGWL